MGKSAFIVASWLMFNIDSRRGDMFFYRDWALYKAGELFFRWGLKCFL